MAESVSLRNLINYIGVLIVTSLFSMIFVYACCIAKNTAHTSFTGDRNNIVVFDFIFLLGLLICIKLFKLSPSTSVIASYTTGQCILLNLALLCCFFFISCVQVIDSYNIFDTKLINIYSLSISIFSFSFFIIIVLLSRSIKEKNIHKQAEEIARLRINEQEKRFELISQNDTALRRFRHDIKSHLSVLHLMLKQQSYNEALSYLDSIGTKFSDDTYNSYTNIVAVDAVIGHFHNQMNLHNIEFIFERDMITHTPDVDVFDLCTVFDNILSNAVEACSNTEIEKPFIKLSINTKNNHWIISETNSVNHDVQCDSDGIPISTKHDELSHGFGIKNIIDTVAKYSGEFVFSHSETEFNVQVVF